MTGESCIVVTSFMMISIILYALLVFQLLDGLLVFILVCLLQHEV